MKILNKYKILNGTVCIMKTAIDKYFLIPSDKPDDVIDNLSDGCQFIKFQNGTILEDGVNGVTEASLMKILIDRYENFQSGKFPSTENELILKNLYEILTSINHRTRDRLNRNVEGKLEI